jgi:hypothetical protein
LTYNAVAHGRHGGGCETDGWGETGRTGWYRGIVVSGIVVLGILVLSSKRTTGETDRTTGGGVDGSDGAEEVSRCREINLVMRVMKVGVLMGEGDN